MMKSAINNNKFLKVVIATKRAKQLLKGASALVKVQVRGLRVSRSKRSSKG